MANFADKAGGKNSVGTFGAYVPRIFVDNDRDPTVYDWQGYNLLDEWLNKVNSVSWILLSLAGTSNSKGPQALWVIKAGPSGNITSFVTLPVTGTAVPFAGVLTFTGTGDVTVSASGSTITINGSGSGTITGLKSQDGNTVTPTAGVIQVSGSNGLTTTGTVGPNTLTITAGGSIAQSFPTDSGTATPATGILNILTQRATLGAGSSVFFSAPGPSNTVQLNVTDVLGNTILGASSGNLTLTSTNCVGFGANNLVHLTSGSQNVALGVSCLTTATTAANCIAIGNGSQTANVSSNQNVAIGVESLNKLVSGGGQNVSIGEQSMFNATTSDSCTAIGLSSIPNLLTGNSVISIGESSGSAYVGAESNNIILGSTFGTAAESNVMRLGNDGSVGGTTTSKTFVSGVAGVTTVVADAVAVLISASTGQLGTISSSARYKDNIENMGSLSNDLYKLRPVVFNYKSHSPESKSVGLIAEEVADVMSNLVVYKDGLPETIKYQDIPVLLLNELQILKRDLLNSNLLISELITRIELLEKRT
jgi:hypothetical protein